jgi:phosphoenolpyruvate synthase/pyruvate phosphate dikinase
VGTVRKSAHLPTLREFIIALADAGEADRERIGPKAANLAALARAGLPTPGGFCLTADA